MYLFLSSGFANPNLLKEKMILGAKNFLDNEGKVNESTQMLVEYREEIKCIDALRYNLFSMRNKLVNGN